MTQDERDALTAKVFATPDGAKLLNDLDDRAPYLAAEIRQSIKRMRAKWRTGDGHG